MEALDSNKSALSELQNVIASYGVYQIQVIRTSCSESIRVDFEDAERIARFTAWDDNSCMLEILCVSSGRYVINERRELSPFAGFSDAFNEFHTLLKK